jgi:glycosyltransferase involved in cell wall biosynthesis
VWGIRDDRIGVERRGVGRFLAVAGARFLSRLVDMVIVNSDAVREGLHSSGLARVPIEVVSNGIDTERFRPDQHMRKQERARLGLTSETLIVCVARLVPKKNHTMLLKSFAVLHQSRPDLRLLCFGDGPDQYRRSLEEVLKQLDLVGVASLERSRDDPEAIFNAADLAVLASDAEGFPNTVAEALACVTPCVSTAVGSAPMMLDAIALSPAGDTASFTQAISAALDRVAEADNPRLSLLPATFTLDALARRTVAVLSQS